MIEIIFLIGLGAVLYHLYNVINGKFDINKALILFILQLILLGLFISLTAMLQDLKISVMTRFISLFFVIELILLIIEVLFKLGYITIKELKKFRV